jgi:glycosyltransferase involved in cell wall biosynthesis
VNAVENFTKPLVSVVIPCYNSGATLLRAVDSIFQQTYSKVEVIVVNDGSSEIQTLEKIKDLDSAGVKVISHDINKGLPCARNSGFRASSGEYVLFLDADDWFSETMIEEMIESTPIGVETFFIFTDIFFEGERSGPSTRIYKPFSQLVINRFPYALMIKKSSISWSPLYDEEFTHGLEDWGLNLKFLELGFTPIRVGRPLFHYHVSSQGMFAQDTQTKYFSIWKEIRKSRYRLYSSQNLKRLIKIELSDSNLSTILLPLLLLIVSKLPITRFLNEIFNVFNRLRWH